MQPATESSDESDDGHEVLQGVVRMRRLGLRAPLAAAIAGISVPTVTRWQRHLAQGLPLRVRHRTGPAAKSSAAAEREVTRLVRELRGQVGAATLGKTVRGISRRQAARVKAQALSAMERERKRRCARVHVTTAGVVRGFDQLQLTLKQGTRYGLIAADAAVPFRTSVVLVQRYDTASVVTALERDIAEYGAPLVYRMDRATCQRTSAVDELLQAHGVLRLHGPPRYPRYYGQLERQNREHREWLGAMQDLDDDEVLNELRLMCAALNGQRPRPTLGYRTAQAVWNERPTVDIDRTLLREEVRNVASRIAKTLDPNHIRGPVTDFAERLAIEQALTQRGYLRCEPGGRC
jgi:hypothetical protein